MPRARKQLNWTETEKNKTGESPNWLEKAAEAEMNRKWNSDLFLKSIMAGLHGVIPTFDHFSPLSMAGLHGVMPTFDHFSPLIMAELHGVMPTSDHFLLRKHGGHTDFIGEKNHR